jgi:hypothetical protein
MTVVLSPDHGHGGSLRRTDGSERLLSGELLLLWPSRRYGWVSALGIERREFLLASVDLRAFETPLVVVERDVVVRLSPCEDALDCGIGNFEERGSGVFLTVLC